MDPQLQEIVRQIADAVDKKVSMRLDEAEACLTSAAKTNMEELRELLRETAERNRALLESIERRLAALEQKVDTGFVDHGRMLRQHTLQLNALGRKQVAPRSPRH